MLKRNNRKLKNNRKIAVLSDVHSNLRALKNVLADAKKEGIQEFWFLGDYIGYGTHPNEVISIIRGLGARCITGNYDVKVLDFPKYADIWRKEKHPSKFFSIEWTYDHLTRSSKTFLRKLPEHLDLSFAGKKFLLVHGSPEDMDEPLRKNTSTRRFRELAQKVHSDYVFFGHTHVYFTKNVNSVTFVNPGGVSRSFDGDPRASYVILEEENSQIKIIHKRIRYDLGNFLREMSQKGFPKDLIDSIKHARSL